MSPQTKSYFCLLNKIQEPNFYFQIKCELEAQPWWNYPGKSMQQAFYIILWRSE